MKDESLGQDSVMQILNTAGCPEPFIEQFLATESTTDQLRLLRTQRCRQLDRMHDEAKKLDILDFLRDKLEKSKMS